MTFRIKSNKNSIITSVNKNNDTIHQLQFLLTVLIKVKFKRVKFTKIDFKKQSTDFLIGFSFQNGNIIVEIQKSALLSLTLSEW